MHLHESLNKTLFPRQPIIPRLMQEILKWLTCCTSSFLTHTVTKIPTICLLAIRLYFIWSLLDGMDISPMSNPLDTSSSSSKENSSSLICDCWFRKQKSLLCFLSNSGVQLQVFSLLPLSTLKVLLTFLREGFEKNKEPAREAEGLNPLEAKSDDLFSD